MTHANSGESPKSPKIRQAAVSGRRIRKRLFSESEEQRIADAIATAETKTSGEIVAVIAAEASSYLYAPFLWAALLALLVPWPLIYFTWATIVWIYGAQLAVFAVLLALFLIRPMRYWLVPASIKRARAHRRAVEQFIAQNLHTTEGRTGLLIFVSVAERYAELLADTNIEEKVPEGTWQQIVDRLTAKIGAGDPAGGFIEAIETCGHHLAAHFPPGTADPNELPDHLIVIE